MASGAGFEIPKNIKQETLFGDLLRTKLGLIGTVGTMALALLALPKSARSESGGYPDAAKPCVAVGDPDYGKTSGSGYWCDGYQWGDSPSLQTSARGYDYRNCTDWVAYRIPQLVQKTVPRGWGNATNWDDAASAAGYMVDMTPESGDIAEWDGTYGHVAVVESVNADGSVNVSEYNWNQDGNYDARASVRANHYIDLNGSGVGINGMPIAPSPAPSPVSGSGKKPNHTGTMTIGVYNPKLATFDLRNSNTSGWGDVTLQYGNVGDIPLVGDWNGDGIDTIGIYDPKRAVFNLRNSNSTGVANLSVQYGNIGDVPIVGDWNGDGIDTIGVYVPSQARFNLRNSNTPGNADVSVQYGNIGAKPLVGDWNNDGVDTIGVYNPALATFDLRNSNTPGWADTTFQYGNIGAWPLAGDWDGNGYDSAGLYNPGLATFDLRNMNSTGVADISVQYGNIGAIPIVGDWDGR